MQKKVDIIVLNYNGKELLGECLPSIIKAVNNSRHICRVWVLDNKSQDGSVEFVKEEFPEVDVYSASKNMFLVSYNELVGRLDSDIVIFLNNDIKLAEDFLDPLVEIFIDYPDAFMAGPKCWTFDFSRYEGSKTKIRFHFGFIQAFTRYPGYENEIDKFSFSAASGSVVAFDRSKFIALGGFDDLYLPGRVEDLDLCYRGWKIGWKGYYQPRSLAFHKGSVAFRKRFGERGNVILSNRNSFLFIWKNITGLNLVFQHFVFLIPRLIYSIITLDFTIFIGFCRALPRAFSAFAKRKKAKDRFFISDREIFEYVGF